QQVDVGAGGNLFEETATLCLDPPCHQIDPCQRADYVVSIVDQATGVERFSQDLPQGGTVSAADVGYQDCMRKVIRRRQTGVPIVGNVRHHLIEDARLFRMLAQVIE